MRYTKIPVTIDAMRWSGSAEDATPIINWILRQDGAARYVGEGEIHHLRRPDEYFPNMPEILPADAPAFLVIETLEGPHRANAGDYIIRGIKGEFYPHAGAFFLEAYRPASEETE